jgi:SAM-dependent methyltransferase
MSGDDASTLPHSAIYFGDTRDFWWNDDQLDLIARRVSLAQKRRVLDVGCGYGHWARLLLPRLAPDVSLTGVDPEERSLAEAERRTAAFVPARAPGATCRWLKAAVETLPFEDGSFDLVTAQTVLIHVADIGRAVAEMTRVLAPGGLLLLAEPNNLAGTVAQLVDGPALDVDRVLLAFELELRIQRGKEALGEGFISAGEFVVRWLDPQRFSDVRQWLCDRSHGVFPPYATEQQRADIAESRDFAAKGWHDRPRDTALRYFLAGGGSEASFERAWQAALEGDRRRLAAIDDGTHAVANGHVFHVFAATKR